jgi:pimeloyl-ACP methyl ester carboxylesterase
MKIKANGINMNYDTNGNGENLVLIHGAGDNLNMWYHQVPVFSKNYCVITYDVRGSGKTDSPKGDYSMPLLAEDVCELVKALAALNLMNVDSLEQMKKAPRPEEAQCFLLGYSMGGRIALEAAINHPEMVKAVILANSSVGLAPPSPDAAERRRALLELLGKGDMKQVAEMMTTGAFSPGFKAKNPSEFDKYKKVKLQQKPEGLARIMQTLASVTAPPDLSKVQCPVLLIVGENDAYMGVEQGKQAHEAIAGSKLVVLPTGHAAAIEAPDKFNAAVLEFLSEVRGKLP